MVKARLQKNKIWDHKKTTLLCNVHTPGSYNPMIIIKKIIYHHISGHQTHVKTPTQHIS